MAVLVDGHSRRHQCSAAGRTAVAPHASGRPACPREAFCASDPLVIAIQNVAEFWNAATRPLAVNGLGMTIDQVRGEVKRLEGFFEIVSESADSYAAWKALVTTHRVNGAQVHDARLAAVMTASGITRILTFNVRDFIRFAGIEAIHPEQIVGVDWPGI
jgi:predicted nucleic acid-binding protein